MVSVVRRSIYVSVGMMVATVSWAQIVGLAELHVMVARMHVTRGAVGGWVICVRVVLFVAILTPSSMCIVCSHYHCLFVRFKFHGYTNTRLRTVTPDIDPIRQFPA